MSQEPQIWTKDTLQVYLVGYRGRADFKDFLPVGTSYRREAIYVGTFYYFPMDFPMIIRSPRKVQKIRRNVGTIQVDAFLKLRTNTPAALSKFSVSINKNKLTPRHFQSFPVSINKNKYTLWHFQTSPVSINKNKLTPWHFQSFSVSINKNKYIPRHFQTSPVSINKSKYTPRQF